MERIIYTNDEGGMSIVVPSSSWEGSMQELAEKVVPKGIKYEIIDSSEIPADREFRNAWELDNKSIKINPVKKQGILDKKVNLIDVIDSSPNTIAAVKDILRKMVK